MKKLTILSTLVFVTVVSMTSCQNQNEVLLPKSAQVITEQGTIRPQVDNETEVKKEESPVKLTPGTARPARETSHVEMLEVQ